MSESQGQSGHEGMKKNLNLPELSYYLWGRVIKRFLSRDSLKDLIVIDLKIIIVIDLSITEV